MQRLGAVGNGQHVILKVHSCIAKVLLRYRAARPFIEVRICAHAISAL